MTAINKEQETQAEPPAAHERPVDTLKDLRKKHGFNSDPLKTFESTVSSKPMSSALQAEITDNRAKQRAALMRTLKKNAVLLEEQKLLADQTTGWWSYARHAYQEALTGQIATAANELGVHVEHAARLLQELIDLQLIEVVKKETTRVTNKEIRELVNERFDENSNLSFGWVAEQVGAYDGSTVSRALGANRQVAGKTTKRARTDMIQLDLAEKVAQVCGIAPVSVYGDNMSTGATASSVTEITAEVREEADAILERAAVQIDEKLDGLELQECNWQAGAWSQAARADHRIIINLTRAGCLRVIDAGPDGPRLIEWLREADPAAHSDDELSLFDSAIGIAEDYMQQLLRHREGSRADNPWMTARPMVFINSTSLNKASSVACAPKPSASALRQPAGQAGP